MLEDILLELDRISEFDSLGASNASTAQGVERLKVYLLTLTSCKTLQIKFNYRRWSVDVPQHIRTDR